MSSITDVQAGSNSSRRGMVFPPGANDAMLVLIGLFFSTSLGHILNVNVIQMVYDNTSTKALVD